MIKLNNPQIEISQLYKTIFKSYPIFKSWISCNFAQSKMHEHDDKLHEGFDAAQ